MAGDFAGARERLNRVKAAQPTYPYVQSMLGYLDLREHRTDAAIAEIKAELEAHPDADIGITVLLAGAYTTKGDTREAISVLKKVEGRGDARVSRGLADLEHKSGDDEGSLRTLRAALAAHPEDRGVQTQLTETLVRLHRETEAASAAKAAMDGSDDPTVLNSNAYVLAEVKTELPLAETKARRAVDLLEEASARQSIDEVNNAAFQRTDSLVATWDTLGWIYFLEGRLKDAESLVAAAWFNQPNLVVGDHLAQIREALGQKTEALTLEELAVATDGAAGDEETMASVRKRMERLRSAGAKSMVGDARAALQRMRTFEVKRPANLKGWGTFRVELAGDGVRESALVQGAPTLKPMTEELKRTVIAGAVPKGSQARLVRDGVLSCSSGAAKCEFVLMPRSSLQAETVE